jgi:hypothetical protein
MERTNLSTLLKKKTITRKGFIQMANLQSKREEKVYFIKGMDFPLN